jgi:hypothetical protein
VVGAVAVVAAVVAAAYALGARDRSGAGEPRADDAWVEPVVVHPTRRDVRSVVSLTGVVAGRDDGLEVVAVVAPELLYRFYEEPVEVVARIDRGPAPFVCPFVAIGPPEGSAPSVDTPVELRCRVPDDVRAFAGVRVDLAVTTAEVTDALVVPVTAVEGTADTGRVTVVLPSGEEVDREVTLGITDGVVVEVIAGLDESDAVLDPPRGLFDPET